MKVAITSQGPDLDSQVDRRFDRAKGFVIVDTETEEFTSHDNSQNLNAAQGAGIQAARHVAELGVEALVTGNVGPKAFATLGAADIKVYIGAKGSVKDALEQFKAGQLQCASKANVEGHWA